MYISSDKSPITRSIDQAMNDPHWRTTMDYEMSVLHTNHTCGLVPKLVHANFVGFRWMYRHKLENSGCLECYKGRLVAQGFSQQHILDFDDTFNPIIKPATIRTVYSISISKD